MLSHRYTYFWLPVLLLASLSAAPAMQAGSDNSQVSSQDTQVQIKLRDPRTQIRAQLLQFTPLGSSADEVLAFIKHRLKPENADEVKVENQPVDSPSAASSDKRGTRRIKLVLGPYLTSPGLLLLDIPLPLRNALVVQWAFDNNNKLIEIFLDRESR